MSVLSKKLIDSPMSFLKKYKLPILSGVLQATSYIPFLPWGLFFSLVPLWFFWTRSDLKKNIVGTLVCAFVASFIGFYWIAITAHDFGKLPWPVAILALMAFSVFANLHLVVSAASWSLLHLTLPKKYSFWMIPFITAISVCFIPTLFPWNFGYAWIYSNLPGAQLSDIMGVVSLATATIFINFFVFQALNQKKYVLYGALAVVTFVSINVLGLVRTQFLTPETESINVALIQANVGNLEKQRMLSGYGFRDVVINKYLDLTRQAVSKGEKLDLVVWPETAYPSYINLKDFQNTNSTLSRLAQDNNFNFATGFYDVADNEDVSNAILYVNRQGEIADRPTHKTILLAFGEYLPLGNTFPALKRILPQVADFKRGPGPETRQLDNLSIAPLICYEALFPLFTRDLVNQNAHLILNVTNDSWYDDWFEPNQHLYITAGRALETRRPVLRATNTGLTTVIQSNGQPMEISPRGQEWVGVYKVSYPDKNLKTIYQKWGKNLHYMILIGLSIIIIALGRFRKS